MAYTVFKSVKITGIVGVVPRNKIDNRIDHVDEEQKEKIIQLTGIAEYRKAPQHICTSDLCQRAAEILFEELNLNPSVIDAIIFVSQTPDYRVPATSCVLQHKMHCNKNTITIDINSGCTGFIHGLYTACSFINGGQLKKVLLLCGDTQTKLVNMTDKNVSFILGDGGTATLLETDTQASEMAISLYTDGSRYDKLIIPASGYRSLSSPETRKVKLHPDGEQRSLEHLFMDGMAIFNFSATDVVQAIINFMEQRKLTTSIVDYLFLHQANKFLTDKIARKLGFPLEKVPYSLAKFGNTSSASIPLTMAHYFSQKKPHAAKRCLLSGFGVGLTWGVVDIILDNIHTPMIEEI